MADWRAIDVRPGLWASMIGIGASSAAAAGWESWVKWLAVALNVFFAVALLFFYEVRREQDDQR